MLLKFYIVLPTLLGLFRSQIMHKKRHLVALVNVTRRLFGLTIQIANRMLVECVGVVAMQDVLEARRIGEAEYAISNETSLARSLSVCVHLCWDDLRWCKLRRTDDGNTLRHHDLVSSMRMEVP